MLNQLKCNQRFFRSFVLPSLSCSLFLIVLVLNSIVSPSYAAYVDGKRNQYGIFRAVSPTRFIALTLPTFVQTDNVKLADNEWVIGMIVGNDARCYPVRQMWYHHIENDYIGGQKLSVTY
jgi:hypothetical protein